MPVRAVRPVVHRACADCADIAIVTARIGQGVKRWVVTGQMPELPEGLTPQMLSGGGLLGARTSFGSSLGGAITGALSAVGSYACCPT